MKRGEITPETLSIISNEILSTSPPIFVLGSQFKKPEGSVRIHLNSADVRIPDAQAILEYPPWLPVPINSHEKEVVCFSSNDA